MEITNKIQCPGCGATASFMETEPGYYTCAYCSASFEHRSILPAKTGAQIFYQYAKELYEKHLVLTPENAKYYSRMFTAILNLDIYLQSLRTSKFYEPIFKDLKALIFREIELLKKEKVHVGMAKEAIYNNPNNFARLKYLVFYYTIIAQHSSQIAPDEEALKEALTYIENAEMLQAKLELGYETPIARTKVGILSRLHSSEKVFNYLAMLTTPSQKEAEMSWDLKNQMAQAKVDFEAILLSPEYLQFIAQKENG